MREREKDNGCILSLSEKILRIESSRADRVSELENVNIKGVNWLLSDRDWNSTRIDPSYLSSHSRTRTTRRDKVNILNQLEVYWKQIDASSIGFLDTQFRQRY